MNAKSRANPKSIAMIVAAWFILQIGGLFRPGLQDDVDSIYIEIAREMLHRHDFVTPYVDGIRFFDKPPLMFWMAAGSMKLFGEFDWAARIPLALATLALFLAVYALGLRLFQSSSPASAPDRGALYAALALATSIGPYLYTRFYIPDIVVALWMTLSIHLLLIALERVDQSRSTLWPSLGFASTLALSLLTKGLIGVLFPIGFVLIYLAITKKLSSLLNFHPALSSVTFLAIALPWHLLAWLRNPAIAMPPGQGLPATAGWAWFYLYNEHFARFLGKRVPHDYGQTPVWLFWVYAMLWVMPWAVFLPGAIQDLWRSLSDSEPSPDREAALTVTIWSLLVLVFFTVSSRQEYYSIPALPALTLLVGGWLARSEWTAPGPLNRRAYQWSLDCHRWLLLPLVSLAGITCAFFVIEAPTPPPGADLSSLLNNNPQLYNLSLGHLFDLTGAAMGLFRGPLTAVAIGMAALGPLSYVLRRTGRTFGANIAMAVGMTLTLLAAHEGLVRFNPILGSKSLAQAILATQREKPQANDLILMDGEYTVGSTLTFYTHQTVGVVNGRVNTLWFGSFWPDAPNVFFNEATLRQVWQGPRRVFLMTQTPASRTTDLRPFGVVKEIASDGGKTVLVNR